MRDAITTWLELAGLLLFIAAAGVAVARFTVAGALAAAGAGCIGASAFMVWRTPRRGGPRSDSDDESTA